MCSFDTIRIGGNDVISSLLCAKNCAKKTIASFFGLIFKQSDNLSSDQVLTENSSSGFARAPKLEFDEESYEFTARKSNLRPDSYLLKTRLKIAATTMWYQSFAATVRTRGSSMPSIDTAYCTLQIWHT